MVRPEEIRVVRPEEVRGEVTRGEVTRGGGEETDVTFENGTPETPWHAKAVEGVCNNNYSNNSSNTNSSSINNSSNNNADAGWRQN